MRLYRTNWSALGIFAALSVVAAVLAACGGSETDAYGESNPVAVSGESVTVEMRDIQFHPKGVKIKPGTTVTWVNRDAVVHNVRQVESFFLSPDVMEQGDTFSFTFQEPGAYRYVCTYHHPNQLGVVIVEED